MLNRLDEEEASGRRVLEVREQSRLFLSILNLSHSKRFHRKSFSPTFSPSVNLRSGDLETGETLSIEDSNLVSILCFFHIKSDKFVLPL